MTQVFLTSASTSPWSKPGDWSDAGHTVELIGAGGNGGAGTTGSSTVRPGGGAGGGGYYKLTYSSGTLGSTTAFAITAAGGATSTSSFDTFATFWQGTNTTNTYEAQAGKAGGNGVTSGSVGAGGAGGSGVTNGSPSPVTYTVTTNNKGGDATTPGGFNSGSSTGGGGAGGPNGVGAAGGGAQSGSTNGASGGGGSNNGSVGPTPSTASGTNGGDGGGGSGHGVGGSGIGGSATAGTGGGGAGGGHSTTTNIDISGGNGASDNIFDSSSHGCGGGGGGGGGHSSATSGTQKTAGGNGANYGGGGGGGGGNRAGSGSLAGGTGGGGLIVITYTPAGTTFTQNNVFTFVSGILLGPTQTNKKETFFTTLVAQKTRLVGKLKSFFSPNIASATKAVTKSAFTGRITSTALRTTGLLKTLARTFPVTSTALKTAGLLKLLSKTFSINVSFPNQARGFYTTSGAGTTDSIQTGYTTPASGQKRSYSIWIYDDGTNGGGGLGRVFDKRTVSAQTEGFYKNGPHQWAYFSNWTGSINVEWSIDATPTTNQWHHLLVTYDSGTFNAPTIYVDGILQAITIVGSTPSGTITTSSDPYVLGNRLNDSARAWGGMLCDFAIWDGILLTQDDATALANKKRPSEIKPASLVSYLPILGNNPEPDISGNNNNGIVIGTLVTSSPFTDGNFIIKQAKKVLNSVLATPSISTPIVYAGSNNAVSTLTTTIDVPAGALALVSAGAWTIPNADFSGASVADSAGNAYLFVTQNTQDWTASLWYCSNCLAIPAGSTITATSFGETLSMMAYYVIGASGGLDKITNSGNGSFVTGFTLSIPSRTTNNQIIITSGINNDNGLGNYTEDANFTDLLNPGGGPSLVRPPAYDIVSNSSSYNWSPSWTTSTGYSVAVGTFKASPGGILAFAAEVFQAGSGSSNPFAAVFKATPVALGPLKNVGKILNAFITSTFTELKRVSRTLSFAFTSTAQTIKQAAKTLLLTITSTFTTRLRQVAKTLTEVVTSTVTTVTKAITKTKNFAFSSTAQKTLSAAKTLTTTIVSTFTTRLRQVVKSLLSLVTFTVPTNLEQAGKTLTTNVAITSAIQKAVFKTWTSIVTLVNQIQKTVQKLAFNSIVTLTALIATQKVKLFSATAFVTMTSTILKSVSKTWTFVATVVNQAFTAVIKSALVSSFISTAQITKQAQTSRLASFISTFRLQQRTIGKILTAPITLIASLFKAINKSAFVARVTETSQITKQAQLPRLSTVVMNAQITVRNALSKTLVATINLTNTVIKTLSKAAINTTIALSALFSFIHVGLLSRSTTVTPLAQLSNRALTFITNFIMAPIASAFTAIAKQPITQSITVVASSVIKQVGKLKSFFITTTAIVVPQRVSLKVFNSIVTMTSQVSKSLFVARTAFVNIIASTFHKINKSMTQGITTAFASITKQVGKIKTFSIVETAQVLAQKVFLRVATFTAIAGFQIIKSAGLIRVSIVSNTSTIRKACSRSITYVTTTSLSTTKAVRKTLTETFSSLFTYTKNISKIKTTSVLLNSRLTKSMGKSYSALINFGSSITNSVGKNVISPISLELDKVFDLTKNVSAIITSRVSILAQKLVDVFAAFDITSTVNILTHAVHNAAHFFNATFVIPISSRFSSWLRTGLKIFGHIAESNPINASMFKDTSKAITSVIKSFKNPFSSKFKREE